MDAIHVPRGTGPDSINRVYLGFAIGGFVYFALFEALYFSTTSLPYDRTTLLVGWDFVNTWMGGRVALHGNPQALFDFQHYNDVLKSLFPAQLPRHNWSYPPHILLLIWPLGLLPYLSAFVAWLAAGLGLFLWVASEGRMDVRRLGFLAFSPVVMVNVLTGQNGLFTGAIILAALYVWDRRPMLAGLLFGILTIKPQLGLLIPLVLILTGRWRCLASAVATTIAMIAASAAIYGPSVWTAFVFQVVPFQDLVLTHSTGLMLGMMPTAFINARFAGLPLSAAWALQAMVALAALVATIWTFWKRRDPLLSIATLLTASLLITPYAFNYDMAALTVVAATLAGRADSTPADVKFAIAIWLLPVAMMLGFLFHLTGSVFVLIAYGARLIQRLWRLEMRAGKRVGKAPLNRVSADTI